METRVNTSDITPDMIGHYREFLARKHWVADWIKADVAFGNTLFADPEATPFVLQFHNRGVLDWEIAYLAVEDGRVRWRYAKRDPGYPRCPLVTEREALYRLDALFLLYYRKHRLPGSLAKLKERLGPWDRAAWASSRFFGRKKADIRAHGLFRDEVVAELYAWDGPMAFLDQFSESLYRDEPRFSFRWVGPGRKPRRVIAIRFEGNACYVDVAMPGNLYLHLLLCLNQVLSPQYEIRRYRDGNTGDGGILLPMPHGDWETLEARHGQLAVDARFERITADTVVTAGQGKMETRKNACHETI